MRKTLLAIATIVALGTLLSARNAQKVGINVDSFAPNITVTDNDSTWKLSDLRGNFVLLNFWASNNAESRIRNIEYNKAIDNFENVQFASINYDRSKAIYEEIIRLDNVNKDSQFYDEGGTNSEVYKQFHLENDLNSYLLNQDGQIVAVNPDMQELTKILCQ